MTDSIRSEKENVQGFWKTYIKFSYSDSVILHDCSNGDKDVFCCVISSNQHRTHSEISSMKEIQIWLNWNTVLS